MLVYVEFLEWEQKLLRKAAENLNVTNRCTFLESVNDFADDGSLHDFVTDIDKYPAVIFLNIDATAGKWRKSLSSLKSHEILASVPVVGLGNLPSAEISEIYQLGGNSYIQKPNAFDEMMQVSTTCLNYWLETSLLPNKFLTNQISD